MSRSSSGSESGMASVTAVTMVTLVLAIAFAMVQVGLVIAGKHQAAAAADLAALAGSSASLNGHDGCAQARMVARRNRVELSRCRTDLAVVTVMAVKVTPTVWGGRWRATSIARAAPDFYVVNHPRRGRDENPRVLMP